VKRPGEITVNREKALAWRQRSRQALKPKRHPSTERAVRTAVFERDGWQCALANGLTYCDGPLNFHHRRKASAGGAYSIANGLTLCQLHNGRVEDEPWDYEDRVIDGRHVVVRERDPEWTSLGRRAARAETGGDAAQQSEEAPSAR
jgi:hypothetical protein